jgi:Cu-Zn family superoxide dismutase
MRIRSLLSAGAAASLVVATASLGVFAQGPSMHADTHTKAVAVLIPTKTGGSIAGVITFTKASKGTIVKAELTGVPEGKHGFHIHEFGDASSPDGKAAGSHFDPKMAKKHGDPWKTDVRHLGDLGNLVADASGKASYSEEFPDLPIGLILGHGVVVHEKADDFGQPVGNAGGRLAVGVIGVAKGE